MATPTHIIDNGEFTSWIGPDENLYNFLTPLQVMDGENRYMRVLFRLVRPGWSGDLSPEELRRSREEFIQTAGSAAALTVEIRTGDRETGHLYTLGRLPADAAEKSGSPDVEIRRGANKTLVYPDEVFAAEEVADIMYHYYQNDSTPATYSLRETSW